jgi:hypothetical protein
MVAAARIGEQHDGYLVGAPGYRQPIAALANLLGAVLWRSIATPGATVNNPMLFCWAKKLPAGYSGDHKVSRGNEHQVRRTLTVLADEQCVRILGGALELESDDLRRPHLRPTPSSG